MSEETKPLPLPTTAPDDPFFAGVARGVSFARIFTGQSSLVLPADLADALTGRGFVPGFTDPEGKNAAWQEAGLADVRFTLGGEGYRIVSLSSSRGNGCKITVRVTTAEELPDDYLARRAVPKPRCVYLVLAGGPGNSDRNLCENIAESLMILTDGLAEIGGRGPKGGNRPELHDSFWLGSLRTGDQR
ncbi:MAG: hypothetical protein H7145_04510 [Akkermansiaceae bacterium]|nr:hypothetical protein [Armatimonadota bacterium]